MSWRTVYRLLLLVAATIAGTFASHWVPAPLPELTRAEFMAEVHAGHVHAVDIEDQEVILSESTVRGPFRTGFDKAADADLPDTLRALGVEIRYSRSALGV
jgi:hypothetical protein